MGPIPLAFRQCHWVSAIAVMGPLRLPRIRLYFGCGMTLGQMPQSLSYRLLLTMLPVALWIRVPATPAAVYWIASKDHGAMTCERNVPCGLPRGAFLALAFDGVIFLNAA